MAVADDGLRVQGLTVELQLGHPLPAPVLEEVSLQVAPGRVLALAGESGSGKTLLGLAIAGLLPEAARVRAGRAWLAGRSLLDAPAAERRRAAGREIGIVFQEPMSALNPVLTIGAQVAEVPRLHGHGRREAQAMALAMLEQVRIPDAARVMKAYPHQLSGGMRQRVLVAMALVLGPRLVIADEPTTALDVTLQAEVLGLLRSLQRERGTAMLLISHDLPMLAQVADDVAVLYAGRIVESAPAAQLFAHPRHPYTRGLLAAQPRAPKAGATRWLQTIEGQVPAPGQRPAGCAFAPRCALATGRCRGAPPPLQERAPAHRVACVEAA